MGINTSTIKGFIRESGFRASGDSVDVFRKELEDFAAKRVEAAKEVAEARGMKTIKGEHFVDSLKAEEVEENSDEE